MGSYRVWLKLRDLADIIGSDIRLYFVYTVSIALLSTPSITITVDPTENET